MTEGQKRDVRDAGVPEFSVDGDAGWGALPAGAPPDVVVEALRPFVSDRRAERIESVLAGRTLDLTVVLDRLHDPHNCAAVLRTCEAHGVQVVHAIEGAERFMVSRRVTKGADRWLTLRRWTRAANCIAALRADGFALVAASPSGGVAPERLDARGRIAFVLGHEHEGISPEVAAACDLRVTAPMRGFAESLNVSVAAGICLAHLRGGFSARLPVQVRDHLRALYYTRSVDGAEEIVRRRVSATKAAARSSSTPVTHRSSRGSRSSTTDRLRTVGTKMLSARSTTMPSPSRPKPERANGA